MVMAHLAQRAFSASHPSALQCGCQRVVRASPAIVAAANRRERFSRRHQLTVTAATGNNNDKGSSSSDDTEGGPSTSGRSSTGIPAVLLLFVSSAAWTATNLRDELGDIVADDVDLGDLTLLGLGLGDLTGALLWSIAMWYASPLQLLLVFLGKIDTERPSDWLMYNIGRAAQLPVNDIDYVAPAWVCGAAASACVAGGVGIASLLGWGLGDATWSVSSGLGALFAAAVFEAGRPQRLSVDEAKVLEAQWQDFAVFANDKLQRSGRCHESEVFNAFRRSHARYRSADVLPDSALRDMVRNWQPGVERTRMGYLKNVSLRAQAPKTGDRAAAAAAAVGASTSSSTDGQASSGSALLDSIAEAANAQGSSINSSSINNPNRVEESRAAAAKQPMQPLS